MTEPITIDGKQYEQHPFNGLMEGWIALKPLPKQPEAEKKYEYSVSITSQGAIEFKYDQPLIEHCTFTLHQAQLAADAVKELLAFIQGKEKFSNTTAELMVKARNAMKDSE